MKDKDKSYLTAITRKKLSAPMRWLYNNRSLGPNIIRRLDYGCGQGSDVVLNPLAFERYDPHFFPTKPKGKFDLITCIYVLNVLQPNAMEDTIERVFNLLAPGGTAYFAVRRDVSPQGFTKRGTFQCEVLLPFRKIVENKSFCIYYLVKPIK